MKQWWRLLCAVSVLGLVHHDVYPQASPSFANCITELRRELPSHPEVRPRTFDRYVRDATDLRPTIEKAAGTQPEFQLPIWDYLARRVDAQRVTQGLELLERESATLSAIARRHGVDAATSVAVFGVETDYGRVPDTYPVIDATLSRACLNLKSVERKGHFFAALWLLQEGAVQQADFKGSWAGAFGLTQFMPVTFIRYMSDGAGMPVSDIIHSVPDALATTARYLRGLGWQSGMPWGFEVKVPPQLGTWHAPENDHGCLVDSQPAGKCRSIAAWRAAGVTVVDDGSPDGPGSLLGSLPSWTPTALMLPTGPQGPAWLVTSNYHAIWRYNHADAYALAIGLLSDLLRGGPPQRVAWPTDDPGLSRAEFRELQGWLRETGHCDVSADGADGPRTQAALREEEQRLGLPVTGRAGVRMLTLLRIQSASTASCEPPAMRPEVPAPAPPAPSASSASTVDAAQPGASSPASAPPPPSAPSSN